jgi:hypothetical protein
MIADPPWKAIKSPDPTMTGGAPKLCELVHIESIVLCRVLVSSDRMSASGVHRRSAPLVPACSGEQNARDCLTHLDGRDRPL